MPVSVCGCVYGCVCVYVSYCARERAWLCTGLRVRAVCARVCAFILMEAGARAGRGGASRVSWEPCLALPPSPFTFSEGAVLLPTFPPFLPFLYSVAAPAVCPMAVPGAERTGQTRRSPYRSVSRQVGGGGAKRQLQRCGESACSSRVKCELMSRRDS